MPEILAKRDLLAELEKKSEACGLSVHDDAGQGCSGEVESIRAKWWFGGRKITYRMSCWLTESDHTVHFREAAVERSWGIPPPTLTVETSGWKRSGKRTDASIGGGGVIDYERVRDGLGQVATDAGWRFHLEGGRLP